MSEFRKRDGNFARCFVCAKQGMLFARGQSRNCWLHWLLTAASGLAAAGCCYSTCHAFSCRNSGNVRERYGNVTRCFVYPTQGCLLQGFRIAAAGSAGHAFSIMAEFGKRPETSRKRRPMLRLCNARHVFCKAAISLLLAAQATPFNNARIPETSASVAETLPDASLLQRRAGFLHGFRIGAAGLWFLALGSGLGSGSGLWALGLLSACRIYPIFGRP